MKAPEPITVAPPPTPPKDKRLWLRDTPLTRVQQAELTCTIHNYNEHTDSWLPHVRKLENITAMYASSDSSKWFQRMFIDFELNNKFYRAETYIKRYCPWERTVKEITKRQYLTPRVIVFNNSLIRGQDNV